MKQTRNYREDETPLTGDVVQVYDGSFGDALVCALNGSANMMQLFRSYMMQNEDGAFESKVETVIVSRDRIREMPVYVTGAKGNIENRAGKR